jgi:hypothetical protein
MNADICGVVYPPNGLEVEERTPLEASVLYRCHLSKHHDTDAGTDHRDWGVTETPGEITSWVFTWETEGVGS